MAVKVVIVGTVPEKVNMALVPWVSVPTVGFEPENVKPVEVVIVLLRLVIVNAWVPDTVWALVEKV